METLRHLRFLSLHWRVVRGPRSHHEINSTLPPSLVCTGDMEGCSSCRHASFARAELLGHAHGTPQDSLLFDVLHQEVPVSSHVVGVNRLGDTVVLRYGGLSCRELRDVLEGAPWAC